jgi:hypothetical protein
VLRPKLKMDGVLIRDVHRSSQRLLSGMGKSERKFTRRPLVRWSKTLCVLGLVLLPVSLVTFYFSEMQMSDVSGFASPERLEQFKELVMWERRESLVAAVGVLTGFIFLITGSVGYLISKFTRKTHSA